MVDENEISELINVSKLKEDLQRSLDNLKADYVKNLTIRSGAGWFPITTSFGLFKNLNIFLLQVQLKVCQLNLRGKPMLCKKLHKLEGKDLSYLWLIYQVFHKPSRMSWNPLMTQAWDWTLNRMELHFSSPYQSQFILFPSNMS